MKRALIVLIPIALLGGLIGWRVRIQGQAKQEQARAARTRKNTPPLVGVAVAARRDIVRQFEGVGTVESPLSVQIAPKVPGRLLALSLREGDPVRAGQVVARLDASEIDAQARQQEALVAQARARLVQAEWTAAPTDTGVASQLRQQQAALRVALATIRQAQRSSEVLLASARAGLTDAQARVDGAVAEIASARASLRGTQASLANARARYERVRRLEEKGFVAGQELDDASTRVSVEQNAVEEAQERVRAAESAQRSALAQKEQAQEQVRLVTAKGKTDLELALASRQQAEAALALARANRAQTPAYRANLRALQAAVDAAQAQWRNVLAQKEQTILRAPLSGFVTARYLDPGGMATPGQPVLAVQDMRDVFVATAVPEEEAVRMRVGQPARARVDALPGHVFAGRLRQINAAADLQSRQFLVRLALPNPQNRLKPGMFARVQIETQRLSGAIVVPREAVRRTLEGATVAVVDAQDTARVRPVVAGAEDSRGIAIVRGLSSGERVVVLSQTPVRDGQSVRIGGGREAAGERRKAR